LNYYPFHIGDYASATRHLSWEEDCAYRRMLDVYYTTEKALPADLKQVCRLVLATTDGQRQAVATVLEEFFEATPEGWVNTRAAAELVEMQDKQQKQRDKANKRWQSHVPEPGNASAMPRHKKLHAVASNSDADAMPPTPTPTPITPTGSGGRAPKPSAEIELPDWVPVEQWTAFVEMRRAKGKRNPFTPAAAKGILAKLQRMKDAGQDVGAVLTQSVVNGWSDVYDLKPGGTGTTGAGIGHFI
jgi:uncharacterized protein YdaU (DUF1376 family)